MTIFSSPFVVNKKKKCLKRMKKRKFGLPTRLFLLFCVRPSTRKEARELMREAGNEALFPLRRTKGLFAYYQVWTEEKRFPINKSIRSFPPSVFSAPFYVPYFLFFKFHGGLSTSSSPIVDWRQSFLAFESFTLNPYDVVFPVSRYPSCYCIPVNRWRTFHSHFCRSAPLLKIHVL